MSKESPKLTRSNSSGFLRPSKRPPLSRSTSDKDCMTHNEETDGIVPIESSCNDTLDSQQTEENSDEESSSEKSNLNDDESVRDSEADNNVDGSWKESDDNHINNLKEDYLPEKYGYSDKDIRNSYRYISFKESKNENKSHDLIKFSCIIGILTVVIIFVFNQADSQNITQPTLDIDTIKKEFPTQHEHLWTDFESGVKDVIIFNRPSTFIFLYKVEAENTVEKLLKQLTKYATCEITECSKDPIIIKDSELNSSEVIDDYGRIIERYRSKLEDKGVMVIKNLENVRGIAAQAFHSFCDEISPAVQKSLFIFTMRINDLSGKNEMNFVEEYFKNKWTDIKIDTYNALITRITSIIVEIKS